MSDKHNAGVLHQQIITFLPSAIKHVIQTYNDFVNQEMSLEAKDFSNHHSACKAAITHLESLLKVLKNTSVEEEGKTDSGTGVTDISLLIAKAKQDLKHYEDNKK